MEPARTRRRWIPILAGIVVLLAFVCIGVVVAIVAVVRQAVDVQTVAVVDADREFEKVRTRFPAREPLLRVGADGEAHLTGTPGNGGSIERLCFLAWDAGEGRLARFSLPFWLVRMQWSSLDLGSYTSDFQNRHVDLTAEDIERYGPGIILDHVGPSGDRVLFWAQ